MTKPIYLIAESGRPKEVLEGWRNRLVEVERGLRAYMDEIGADGAFRFSSFDKPGAFRFPNNAVPDGWTKASAKGASRPKKTNTDAVARLEGLEWCEGLDTVAVDALQMPVSLSYGDEGRQGHKRLSGGRFHAYSACWTVHADGSVADVILIAPDFQAEAAEHEGEEITWKPDGTAPVIPEGFRQVSEAEVDLIFAQAKVAREKAIASAEENQVTI